VRNFGYTVATLAGINKLKEKMVESWLANGVLLAWLIDPGQEVAYIYRQGQTEPEEVHDFAHSVLSGEEVLPGVELPLVELKL
jgi:Uma2 family endonuclease